jgi:HSP20 family protein
MVYRTMFPRDIFAEFDQLQREMQNLFDTGYSIRGLSQGSFPALNVGGTPGSIELYAFAPGLDPNTIEVNLERGVVTISGERRANLPPRDEKAAVHINERFAGRFKRVVSLPEDEIDADSIAADYRDGVLHITAKRREAAQPRRIAIQ